MNKRYTYNNKYRVCFCIVFVFVSNNAFWTGARGNGRAPVCAREGARPFPRTGSSLTARDPLALGQDAFECERYLSRKKRQQNKNKPGVF